MFKKKNKTNSDEVKENSTGNGSGNQNPAAAENNPPAGAEQENPAPQASQASVPENKQDPVKELQDKLRECEDKYLRLRAEFDNYRKRSYKDITDARFNTKLDTVFPVLSVFDHFRLAVTAADKTPEFKVLFDGMKIILSEFQRALDDLGIEVIEAKGKVFDPNLHEAIGKEHSSEIEEGRVISQWRCGYMLGDRLLRPSSVIVSAGVEKPPLQESPVPEEKNNEEPKDQQEDTTNV